MSCSYVNQPDAAPSRAVGAASWLRAPLRGEDSKLQRPVKLVLLEPEGVLKKQCVAATAHGDPGRRRTAAALWRGRVPTDALRHFRDALIEAEEFGLEALKQAQIRLGEEVRGLMDRYSYKSVAADGFKAPSVVVCFAPSAEIKSGKAFAEQGLQIAAGVPLECGEREDYASFRIGLFGLDKLMNIDRTVTNLEMALEKIRGQNAPA